MTLLNEIERYRYAERLLGERDALGALYMLEPLLDEHGDDRGVQLLAARAYYHSAQLGRARETLGALVERDPSDHYARFLLGRTLERSSRHEEALPHLRMAAAMAYDPDYADSVSRVERKLGV
ncbi:tetratricopeptide repeat protein [Nonomuraea sp. NBC_01738]|uniref:tetratricopeptide repeat protein n=1 Tax=Nonomuraea sp. NBC_01738 TaxID=2976003 RepID=UPI002E13C815|nr:tetratricopeptide repeat protein [Nonomuraea sp. NBC_01738]